jgi:1-deoxy-D-xylulose-5-phosphate reductoisomerase
MKKIIVLGSTGSIGRNTLKVVSGLKGYKIVGIAAHTDHAALLKQAASIKPRAIALIDDRHYKNFRSSVKNTVVFCGEEGIKDMIQKLDADILVAAFASAVGIDGIMHAIRKKMKLCLATKEVLVTYGEIIMHAIKKNRTAISPIDSEHSAVSQCLEGRKTSEVLAIILTASGGPFLDRSIRNVVKADVLNHPVWKMGAKITVDSATMMNKGLEIIEAHHLFGIPAEKIKVAIHPEALCHSLVQFIDGSMLCQISSPDMKLPIQYALTAPARRPCPVKYLDIRKVKALHFRTPDKRKFRCLGLAYDALRIGKSMPAVLNGANAAAVRSFLEGRLKFDMIPSVIEAVMENHHPRAGGIMDYRDAEKWAFHEVLRKC